MDGFTHSLYLKKLCHKISNVKVIFTMAHEHDVHSVKFCGTVPQDQTVNAQY